MPQRDADKDSEKNSTILGLKEVTTEQGNLEKPDNSELFIRRAFDEDSRLGCELLYRRYYGSLCSHAVRILSSTAIAEDLVAEIFCELYADDVFKTITTSYRAFLYRTVRNRAYNYLRHALKHESGLEDAHYQYISQGQQPDAITHYEALCRDVEQALQSLTIHRRRAYLMHRFEGKKYKEISIELNVSVRTVEVQIRQASHQIRAILKEKWLTINF